MASIQGSLKSTICRRCILPHTFPGIKFDDQGICNYCHRDESVLAKAPEQKREYRKRLDDLITDAKNAGSIYHAIMAYSGGKDSSYTLSLLRERYGLRVLAFTFDNHFVSPAAWENIRNVTSRLQVDHIRFTPSWPVMKQLFSLTAKEDLFAAPTLLRASAICTACIGLVKSLTLRTALEMGIPLVAFGWSPGQAPIQSAIMRTNRALVRQNQSALKKALHADIASQISDYFIPDGYYDLYEHRFPYNIHPLAFFDYGEKMIEAQLGDLGWKAPRDTDTNSTNCLLNAFANHCHISRHGFHPYVLEIANMVRQGVMSRDEGIAKIYTEQDQKAIEYAKRKLDLA